MKFIHLIFLGALGMTLHAQTVPAIGTDSTIEVANWNLQWFGSTKGGPFNEALQQQNVAAVIAKSQIDIWGLCEISDSAAWDTLQARLPEYAAVTCEWNQTQRTALLYRKTLFRFLYQKHPLLAYSYDFSSGRLPLEVALETQYGGIKDTLVFMVIHMKANVGNDAEKLSSWQRRKNAGQALRTYIKGLGNNTKCMVIGDYNDDLDSSIFTGYATPYEAWVKDTSLFAFPSLELTRAGERSMDAWTDVIDHQCLYGRMRADLVPGSARVFYLQNYVTSYSTTTSDHFPVYSVLQLKQSPWLSVENVALKKPNIYFDGAVIRVEGTECVRHLRVTDLCGREVRDLQTGQLYLVSFESPEGTIRTKIFTGER